MGPLPTRTTVKQLIGSTATLVVHQNAKTLFFLFLFLFFYFKKTAKEQPTTSVYQGAESRGIVWNAMSYRDTLVNDAQGVTLHPVQLLKIYHPYHPHSNKHATVDQQETVTHLTGMRSIFSTTLVRTQELKGGAICSI